MNKSFRKIYIQAMVIFCLLIPSHQTINGGAAKTKKPLGSSTTPTTPLGSSTATVTKKTTKQPTNQPAAQIAKQSVEPSTAAVKKTISTKLKELPGVEAPEIENQKKTTGISKKELSSITEASQEEEEDTTPTSVKDIISATKDPQTLGDAIKILQELQIETKEQKILDKIKSIIDLINIRLLHLLSDQDTTKKTSSQNKDVTPESYLEDIYSQVGAGKETPTKPLTLEKAQGQVKNLEDKIDNIKNKIQNAKNAEKQGFSSKRKEYESELMVAKAQLENAKKQLYEVSFTPEEKAKQKQIKSLEDKIKTMEFAQGKKIFGTDINNSDKIDNLKIQLAELKNFTGETVPNQVYDFNAANEKLNNLNKQFKDEQDTTRKFNLKIAIKQLENEIRQNTIETETKINAAPGAGQLVLWQPNATQKQEVKALSSDVKQALTSSAAKTIEGRVASDVAQTTETIAEKPEDNQTLKPGYETKNLEEAEKAVLKALKTNKEGGFYTVIKGTIDGRELTDYSLVEGAAKYIMSPKPSSNIIANVTNDSPIKNKNVLVGDVQYGKYFLRLKNGEYYVRFDNSLKIT